MKKLNKTHIFLSFVVGVLCMFIINAIVFTPVGSYSQAMSILGDNGTTFTKDGELTYTSDSAQLTYYELKALGKLAEVYDFISITNYESIDKEIQLYECENQIMPTSQGSH
jgi:hypothetical protein